jgi:hypothetical protein
MKGLAYSVLASIASCDHPKAKSKGYADGWEMLLDLHDKNEMAVFCVGLQSVMSETQAKILLDGLAIEYTQFSNWLDFAEACADNPDWVPSKGPIALD